MCVDSPKTHFWSLVTVTVVLIIVGAITNQLGTDLNPVPSDEILGFLFVLYGILTLLNVMTIGGCLFFILLIHEEKERWSGFLFIVQPFMTFMLACCTLYAGYVFGKSIKSLVVILELVSRGT